MAATRHWANAMSSFIFASKVGGIRYYRGKPYEVLEANMLMDPNVLRTVYCEANRPHYFYASSAHVYPVELQMAADAADIVEKAIPVAIARIIGAYGPGQDFDLAKGSAIPVFIRRAIEFPKRAPFIQCPASRSAGTNIEPIYPEPLVTNICALTF